MTPTGPLRGVRVVELGAIGPVPFAGMVLSDLGADVVRIDRTTAVPGADPARAAGNVLDRGRRSVAVDLKAPDGVALVLDLVAGADVLLEGWRPGVAERLGLGPEECHRANEHLVYGRMTGFGQTGPWAERAGHDIGYLAIAGALGAFGREGAPPSPPLNAVADFGGGGMVLALGVVAALFEVRGGGRGQVVDATMVDGAALLLAPFFAAAQLGFWGPRGTNLLDSGAPYYDSYRCADGRWVSVGAIEPQFYEALLQGLGLAPEAVPDRDDRTRWPELRAVLASAFATRTRDQWEAVFGPGGPDACVVPVLDLTEAPTHPHAVARGAFVERDGVVHPGPVPRLSGTPTAIAGPSCYPGQHTEAALEEWGIERRRVRRLLASGAIAQHPDAEHTHAAHDDGFDPGARWQFDQDSYLELARSEIPGYDALQGRLAALTAGIAAHRILDLGSGTGVTARTVLDAHGGADLVGVDASDTMLASARELVPEGRFVVAKLEDELPQGPFDLVVSAFAIHHLDGPAKADLFARIRHALAPGGSFGLLDVVLPAGDGPTGDPVPVEPGHDQPSSVADQVDWLEAAGLSVDVVEEHGDLALVLAHRPD